MRNIILLVIATISISCNKLVNTDTVKPAQIPEGNYVYQDEAFNLTDSITIVRDSAIVYSNPTRGFGSIFRFTYGFEQIGDSAIALHGISYLIDNQPRKMFGSIEEFDWHGDTLKFEVSESGNAILYPPDGHAYKLFHEE